MNPETNIANGTADGGMKEQAAQIPRLLATGDSEVGRSFAALAENLGALGRPTRSVVVTGPERGVGRSTVCLGLGAALVAAGQKVAVVDCNLDRPHLHSCFDRPNFTGLTSALESGKDLESYGFEAVPNLRVIPTGPILWGSQVLVKSTKLVEAVQTLYAERNVVLLDAPVASEVLVTPNLWGAFDGVLLVVHATRTPKGLARGFIDDLLDAQINLFGVVLNGHV